MTLSHASKNRSLIHFKSITFIVLFLSSALFASANTITVTRGTQASPSTINWNVVAGSATCAGTTDYPNSADGIRSAWITGTHPISGNISWSQMTVAAKSAPGYYFTCTDLTSGAVGTSYLIVNDCSGATPNWNGTTCVGDPDLTADIATPSTAVPGTNNTLSAVISNIGLVSTGVSFSNFFQVADQVGGGGTITDLTSASMSTLAAGSNNTATQSYTFPSGPGTYSIRACADKTSSAGGGVITESNEGNNCGSPWTTVTVACTGTNRWDSINHICIDPQVVSADITDQHYPPGDIHLTCNADTDSYSVFKGATLFIGPNLYSGPIILNDVVTESEQYTIKCIHGSVDDSTIILYDATIPAAVVKLVVTETTIDPPASTTIKWEVDYPTAACTLTAKVVCANNACTAAQLANEAAINTILSTTNTDSNDPATSRSMLTAIQSPAPGHKDSDTPIITADYKALGKKTIPVKYTTDITYNCNGTKETKRIRVIKSEEQ